MSVNVLGDRKRRQLERMTGFDIALATTAWQSHRYRFIVTTDHLHGTVYLEDGSVVWDEKPVHFSSCKERFR